MTRAALAGALALALAQAACADDGAAPSTRITSPRLLAIAADPPVATVDGQVALRALAVDAAGRPATSAVAWRACSPWQLVRDPDIDCAPAAALALPVDASGGATLDVAAYLARFGAPPVMPPAGDDPCARPVVAAPVFATVVVDGARLVARKDVALGPVARRAPALAAVLLDGAPAAGFRPGAEHRLTAVPARDSLEPSCSEEGALETVRAYFYVTAGDLDEASATVTLFTDGSEVAGSVGLRAPDERDPLTLWTVLLDDDGGAAWTARTLTAVE